MTLPATDNLAPLTTLRLAARAAQVTDAVDQPSLLAALEHSRAQARDVIVLGEGSNVVFAGDVAATVLRYRGMGRELLARDTKSVLLRVAAGENWHALTAWCLRQGYFGLENLALIPGTIGAAPIQNIGAYGVELAPFVEAVHGVYIESGDAFRLDRKACAFSYRDSIFKHALRDATVITAVDFRLPLSPAPVTTYPSLRDYLEEHALPHDAQSVFDAVVAIRRARLPDPARVPNAGSFFKNPVVSAAVAGELAARYPALPIYPVPDGQGKLSAAWMIEHCGWKGFQANGVGVHAGHALVLVNLGGDSGAELLALADRIRASVQEAFGCVLEIEPRVYGAAA